MPRIVKSNNFIISDEVFTISEDEWTDEQEENSYDVDLPPVHKKPLTAKEAYLEESKREAEELVEKAEFRAKKMLEEARENAEREREEILEQAGHDAEEIKQQAYREGSTAGFQQGLCDGTMKQMDEIKQCIGNLEFGISKMEGEHAGFIAEHEGNLKWLSLEIASKIIGKKLAQDDKEMLGLVKAAIATVKKSAWINVEVSDKMIGLIDALSQELKRNAVDKVDIVGISAPEGTCIVDTPEGIIDASVQTQLENLRVYFEQED